MNKTNGKIAEQSKRALTDALLKCMELYDFREITVTQIAQEAGLSRKTFYRLFAGREEVLDGLLSSLIESFFSRLAVRSAKSYWEVMQLYFDFWQEQRELLLLFRKSGLLYTVFQTAYKRSFDAFLMVRSGETAEAYSKTLPYLLSYSVGGMNSMLLKWAEDGMSVPAADFIAELRAGFASESI